MIKIKEKIKQKGVAGNAFMCYITSWLITVVTAIPAALWEAQTTSFLAVVPCGLNSARPAGEKETLHNPDLGITVTVGELYRATSEGREPKPAPAHLCMAHGQPVKEEDNFGSLANIL